MKKWSLITLILVALVSLPACNQREGDLTPEYNPVTIKATVSNDAQTRTVLGDDTGEQTAIYWSDDESDAFSINIGGTNYIFKKKGQTESSVSADFECENAPSFAGLRYFIATYPAGGVSSYENQTGTKEGLKNWHYMEALFAPQDGDTWNDVVLSFTTSDIAILKFTLVNENFKGSDVTDVTFFYSNGDNNDINTIRATTTFQGDPLTGVIEVYLAVPINKNVVRMQGVSVKATCKGKYYVATLQDKEITYGKLYKINKYMTEGAIDLSVASSANSYIVSTAGSYKFRTVQGNSSNSVGNVAEASVLWESFGTDQEPEIGDLISSVSYDDGYITFKTGNVYKEGNAVIAAKDATGNILWSWHIWLTDNPEEQKYYNYAGTMMDRNLGATSATPGDVGALGLLYQWGRKDPFLGSSSIIESVEAKSTITWPAGERSTSTTGTIEYAVANPTTFILFSNSNGHSDWLYANDNTRWYNNVSNNVKTIYDPCPIGWKVPSRDNWWKICNYDEFEYPYDNTNKGINFSNKFGDSQTIWYPASGSRNSNDNSLYGVGLDGYCWSTRVNSVNIMSGLSYGYDGEVVYEAGSGKAIANSVRCIKMGQ